jgi:hypothetical protein
LLFTSSLTAAGRASDNAAAADALFQAARLLVEEKKFAEACPKFEASYRLEKTFGTLMNMADCHENIGKIATAWAEWGEAAERAAKEGDKRETYVRQRRAALTERLPKLQINVTRPRAGLAVSRDGVTVDEAAYGLPLPVDVGAHRVVVRRGEQVLKEETVETQEKALATVNLDLEAIDKATPPPPPEKTTGPAPLVIMPAPSSQKTIGFVVGGVGGAGVIAAAVVEIVALVKKGNADEPASCVDKFCTQAGLDTVESAATLAEVGQWVGIVGLVGVAVGATLILTAPSAPPAPAVQGKRAAPPARKLWLTPWAGPADGGVLLRGTL